MSISRKRTITFFKSIRDTGGGEYATPSTAQLTEFIRNFCNTQQIKIIELTIQDPFKSSTISIMSTRKQRDELFAYLKGLEDQFILSNVTK